MLQLRPNCEHCNRALPADATNAMICSFECTFCRDCVENVLGNVCPTCGGGFCPRPVRPRIARNLNLDTTHYPPSDKLVLKPVDPVRHAEFSAPIRVIPPEKR